MRTFFLTCFPGRQAIMCFAWEDGSKTGYLRAPIKIEIN